MKNEIGKEFNFFSLIKFAFPTIIMMIFTSMYTMVDGMFVSRFVSTSALSAVNIVFPIYSVIIAIAIMLATGGSAVIAKKLGENKVIEAKENFSFITVTGVVVGIVILILTRIFIHPILMMLGANEAIYTLCFDYATTFIIFTPFAMVQMLFQYFFVTAGKPNLGLVLTIAGGLVNMALDYIFIVPLNMGIKGAALATGIGMIIPAVFGILYFLIYKKGTLYFVRPKFDFQVLLKSCSNGFSEMVNNISIAVVTLLYNIIMMKFLGEDGVAAITILLYAQFLLNAVFFGFSMGVAPIISYNYGSGNVKRLKRIFKYCMIFTVVCSFTAYISSNINAPILTTIFAQKNSNVYTIALHGFKIFNISFLFSGINIFTSAMFTAFSNGKISAIISFFRTFVFITAGLLILPHFLGVEGAWVSIAGAEFISTIMCLGYIVKYKHEYHYC